MKVIVNDTPVKFSGGSIKDLLHSLEKDTKGIAVAINQQVIPKSQWDKTPLDEKSSVFIFESIAGG